MREEIEGYVCQYGRLIFSLCYNMTGDYFEAEDLAQDTFLSAYQSLARFDGRDAKAWLMRIASNKCRDYLKSAQRKTAPFGDEELSVFPDARAGPEQEFAERDTRDRLLRLCQSLSEPYKTAAVCHFAQGESVPELARRTGLNPKTLRTHIYRAREMLKVLWKEENRA